MRKIVVGLIVGVIVAFKVAEYFEEPHIALAVIMGGMFGVIFMGLIEIRKCLCE